VLNKKYHQEGNFERTLQTETTIGIEINLRAKHANKHANA
jgi:hypothetical protein